MIGGILLTNGPIAQALLSASEVILGKQEQVYALSVTDLSLADIYRKLNDFIIQEPLSEGIMILASLKGGSCWNTAARIIREKSDVRLVSGVNLPMFLSFLTKRDKYNLDELADIVAKDGIRGIDKL